MIQIQTLRYKNFLSSGNTFTEIEFDNHKTTLVVGQNGAGKSTLLDALSFALFGRAHRNINKPQLVNSINGKGTVVEVEFRIGSNDYLVRRGIKPVKFEIVVNGKLLNQNSHNKEYQKVLEQNILKLTHKTFHQVVVLGSSSFTPFMQLSTAQRREVIEDLLDINVFSKMNILLKEKNSVLKDAINQILHAIDINDTKVEGQKKYIRDISRMNADAKADIEKKISSKKLEVKNLQSDNIRLTKEIQELNPGLMEARKNIRDIIYGLRSDEGESNNKVKSLVKECKFYETNESCPTCEQDITDELKERKLTEAKTTAIELQSRLAEIAEKHREAEVESDRLDDIVKQCTERDHKIFDNNERIEYLEIEIDGLDMEIEILTDETSDLAKANEDFDKLMSEHHGLVGDKSDLTDQAAYNSVISEMLKDTGIKTKIIKEYLPVINQLVNQHLQVLDFYVHFDLDETFTEVIRSRHRDEFSYESFSEGEKQRIDLALLFTWRQVAKMKNSITTNLLILDETFDSSLDESGIDNLMKIIHTLGDETNVFVISHKGEVLDGKFANKLEFIKDKNFSKLKSAA
jgi:DNA repair exonuclease SbcCD ATPase subunit